MTNDRKKEKFIRLAENRVKKAIKSLRLVGNLSNRSNYNYEIEDAQKIIKVLEKEIRELKRKFNTEQDEETEFTLR